MQGTNSAGILLKSNLMCHSILMGDNGILCNPLLQAYLLLPARRAASSTVEDTTKVTGHNLLHPLSPSPWLRCIYIHPYLQMWDIRPQGP